MTLLRGEVVMEWPDDAPRAQIVGTPRGRYLRRPLRSLTARECGVSTAVVFSRGLAPVKPIHKAAILTASFRKRLS